MSERFGPGAQRFAGLAGQVLGWRPAEFWAATPAELAAILAPALGSATSSMTRNDLSRLMERENG